MMNRFLDWLGYQLLMYGPSLCTYGSNVIGRWCLGRAGGHVYREMKSRDQT